MLPFRSMTAAAIENAYAFLRAHTQGDLRFDEHIRPLKYVIEPGGRLVAPVMVAMLRTFDAVLFVPEAADGALELQLSMTGFEENASEVPDATLPGGALADRWRIHHGVPPDVRWALIGIDAARYDALVIDGDALMRPNPLAEAESGICRRMNTAHAGELRNVLLHYGGIGVDDPVMVAIDPLGLDIRGQFEVYRAPAPEPMPDAATAERVLETMRRTAAGAPSGGRSS